MKTVLIFTVTVVVCWLIWRHSKTTGHPVRKALAHVVISTGLVMAMAIGTKTVIVLPGSGSVGASMALGGAIGWATWAIVGTLGVVPLGIAVGCWSMIAIASGMTALGGLVGGMGFKTVLVPYVPVVVWLPVLTTGLIMLRKRKAPSALDSSS